MAGMVGNLTAVRGASCTRVSQTSSRRCAQPAAPASPAAADARPARPCLLFAQPGQTLVVPLESAFFRLKATNASSAFTSSALSSAYPSATFTGSLGDCVKYWIVPGAPRRRASAPRALAQRAGWFDHRYVCASFAA